MQHMEQYWQDALHDTTDEAIAEWNPALTHYMSCNNKIFVLLQVMALYNERDEPAGP